MNLFLRMIALWFGARRRSRLSIWDTATTPFRVNPMDLDVLGHMNNGRYLSIMDLGRMDLMHRSGFWSVLSEHGYYPVVAGQSITYRRSLQLGQAFEIDTRLAGIDERWVYLDQTFRSQGQLVAHAVVRARFLRRSGGSVSTDELLALTGEPPRDLTPPSWITEWTAESAAQAKG